MKPIESDIRRFVDKLGYIPHLYDPKSHSEHVMRKKYTDRNPLLTETADKIGVRAWIRGKGHGNILLPVHWTAYCYTVTGGLIANSSRRLIPCVVKANNGSGRNVFILEESDVKTLERLLPLWMNPYGQDKGEWCYKNIDTGIIVEPLLWQLGESHIMYRFLCFAGEPHFIEAHEYELQRIGPKVKPVTISHTMYDTNWQIQKVSIDGRAIKCTPPPECISEMLTIATKLSQPFDFVRIDLYLHGGNIYFSEMTHYPRSGRYKYNPREFDYILGRCWK
jgi:hypothetical protein